MHAYVQWTTATAQDWERVEISRAADVTKLPRKPQPRDLPAISRRPNLDPGWVSAINVQGVIFEGFDHYAVEIAGPALVVTCWNDDPDSGYIIGRRWGQRWLLDRPRPDARFGGQVNTVQSVEYYAEANSDPVKAQQTGTPVPIVGTFSDMPMPPAAQTWHGVTVDQALWDAHQNTRTLHGWREWVI